MCLTDFYQDKQNPAKTSALTSWCLQAQRSAHCGPEHSSWVTSLLLSLQSLQVWFISPQREIVSAVRFWFLKSYSILDAVNPVNVNFKDPGCCLVVEEVSVAWK
jgi:hypothetical protein